MRSGVTAHPDSASAAIAHHHIQPRINPPVFSFQQFHAKNYSTAH